MEYTITLPPFAPLAVIDKLVTATSVYRFLTLHHRWLMNALNRGTYPEFMEVDAEGMVTGYSDNKEPAIGMLVRETLVIAKDYHNLLLEQPPTLGRVIEESEKLAMSDYIASIDSIQL